VLPSCLRPGLSFIHVDGREQTQFGSSKVNRDEVSIAIKLLKLLLHRPSQQVAQSSRSRRRACRQRLAI